MYNRNASSREVPQAPSSAKSRLNAVVIALAIGLAAAAIAGPFLVVPVGIFLMNNFAPGVHPRYPGISMHSSDGEIHSVLVGGEAGTPRSFFILVGGVAKPFNNLTASDLEQLGLSESPNRLYGVRYTRGPEHLPQFQTIAELDKGRVETLRIAHRDILIGASREGPFLELPVTVDRAIEVFGKPEGWDREKVQWY